MDTAQLKKAGLIILVLGVAAGGLYFWSKDPIHMYIAIGAGVIGLAMTGIAMVKK